MPKCLYCDNACYSNRPVYLKDVSFDKLTIQGKLIVKEERDNHGRMAYNKTRIDTINSNMFIVEIDEKIIGYLCWACSPTNGDKPISSKYIKQKGFKQIKNILSNAIVRNNELASE